MIDNGMSTVTITTHTMNVAAIVERLPKLVSAPLVQRPADDSQNARQQNGREKRLHYKVATKKNQSAETDS